MTRIDAHQHFWRYDPVRDSWITEAMASIRRDFLPEDVAPQLDAAGVGGVVAVQADQSEAETSFLLGLAAQYPVIRGVVGWIDLEAPDLGERLARRPGSNALKGFRHIAQGEPDDFLARPGVIAGVRSLGEQGFTFDILIYPRQLPAATRLVEQCPEVRFVLDHCAKPQIASGEITAWRNAINRLAAHANVACKISGLVTESDWRNWTAADLLPYLEVAATAFGPERLMFGSDWPVCLLAARYDVVIDTVARWCDDRFSPRERARVFGGTAISVYRLESSRES